MEMPVSAPGLTWTVHVSLPSSMAFLLFHLLCSFSPLALRDPLSVPLSAPGFFAISFYGPSSANTQPMGPARCQALPAPFWGLVSLLPLSPCLLHSHLASCSPFPQRHRALTLVIIQFYEKPPGLPLNGLTTTGTRCAIRAWGYEGGRERGRKGHGWLEGGWETLGTRTWRRGGREDLGSLERQ